LQAPDISKYSMYNISSISKTDIIVLVKEFQSRIEIARCYNGRNFATNDHEFLSIY